MAVEASTSLAQQIGPQGQREKLDDTAVKALLAAPNPLSVIEKAMVNFSQEYLTVLYLKCEELLDKFEGTKR